MSEHDSQDEFFIIDDPFDMLDLDIKFTSDSAESKLSVPSC